MRLTRQVTHAPCGLCGDVFTRDELHSVNVKFFAPCDTSGGEKIAMRFCGGCRERFAKMLLKHEWDPSTQFVKEHDVDDGDDD